MQTTWLILLFICLEVCFHMDILALWLTIYVASDLHVAIFQLEVVKGQCSKDCHSEFLKLTFGALVYPIRCCPIWAC